MKNSIYGGKTITGKNVYLINVEREVEKKVKAEEPVHYVLYIDRSGSMSSHIADLIEDVKKVLDVMREQDYFTVIWFSSSGQFKTVLKGVPNVKSSRENINRVLDTLKSTIGCTCFSDPIREGNSVLEELEAICPKQSAILFTDGCSVCNWSDEEEDKRVCTLLEEARDRMVAFDAIGYGNYCDEDQLKKWVALSSFGEFHHSNDIKDYHEIFEAHSVKVRNMEVCHFDASFGVPVYYFTSNTVNKYNDGEVHLTAMDSKKNQFLIVTDKNDLTVNIDDEDVHVSMSKAKKIAKTWIPSLNYKKALAEYTYGDRYEALTMIANELKDKPFADRIIAAFSSDEIAKVQKDLNYAAFRSIGRNLDTAPDNYLPAEDVPCLLDLIGLLSKSKNNKYIVSNNYKRIGRVAVDENNIFKSNGERAISPIYNVAFNKKNLNVSIGFTINGTVDVPVEDATRVGLPTAYPCKIFRNHTIIKDGNLNMDEITVIVNGKTYDAIKKDYPASIKNVEYGPDGTELVLDLTQIPIINGTYGKATIEELFELVCHENKLMAEIKLAKAMTPGRSESTYEKTEFSEDQAAVLESLHIKNGIYNGFGMKVASVEDSDFYMSRCFESTLKGFSTISSIISDESGIPDIPKNKKGEYKTGDLYMVEALKTYKDYKSETKLEGLTAELAEVRSKIAAIKIAKTLTGRWFDLSKLSDSGKDDVKTYTAKCPYTDKELVMNIKTSHEKCYF